MTDEEMRQLTGAATSESRLTAFLYTLMRDHLPSGKIEQILVELEELGTNEYYFTNGLLAVYAEMLAERLGPDEASWS